MMDYMFICMNQETGIRYYYNFSMDAVYASVPVINKQEIRGKWYGIVWGIIMINIILVAWGCWYLPTIALYLLAAAIGISIAGFFIYTVKRKIINIFIPQNKIEVNPEGKQELLSEARRFSEKYITLEWGIGIFISMAFIIFTIFEKRNLLLAISMALLWGVFVFMLGIYHPYDYQRLKRCWKKEG